LARSTSCRRADVMSTEGNDDGATGRYMDGREGWDRCMDEKCPYLARCPPGHIVGEHVCQQHGGKMNTEPAEEQDTANHVSPCHPTLYNQPARSQEWQPSHILNERRDNAAVSQPILEQCVP
jgi:hypothetical protein